MGKLKISSSPEDLKKIAEMIDFPCHVDTHVGWIMDAKGFAVVRQTTNFDFDTTVLNFFCECLNALDKKKAS